MHLKKVRMLFAQSGLILCNPMETARLPCPWGSPGKNAGVGSHSSLPGIFLSQGSNPCLLHLLHCRHILYGLSLQGSPGMHLGNSKLSDLINTEISMTGDVIGMGLESGSLQPQKIRPKFDVLPFSTLHLKSLQGEVSWTDIDPFLLKSPKEPNIKRVQMWL